MAAFTSLATMRAGATVEPWDLALGRLTFGATPEARDEYRLLGLEAWLDRQLAMPALEASLTERLAAAQLRIEYEADTDENGNSWEALAEDRPYAFLTQTPTDLQLRADYGNGMAWEERIRPAREVIAASLIRAVHAEAQLREVLVQFWHDHFSVNAFKDEITAGLFPLHDHAIRAHALGNFRVLLGATAKSPPMLHYLDNAGSRASPANENYARELLELHTLGAPHYLNHLTMDWAAVPGAKNGEPEGYIDADVYEVARAFTGWTIGDGRWLREGEEAPRTGLFHYADAWHDPYQKRILAREFTANRGPMEDGESVLDILAVHPGTARYVTGKMLARLGLESPSERMREAAAAVFLEASEASDQIAQVVRRIVLDPEFSQTPASKLRRPFEFLAGLYRATGAEVRSPTYDFDWWLERAGWTQHAVRPPTGHSDESGYWANTRCVTGLIRLALFAHDDWFGAAETTGMFDAAPQAAPATWGDLAFFWSRRFGVEARLGLDFLQTVDIGANDSLADDREWRHWVSRSVITLAALDQRFLFR